MAASAISGLAFCGCSAPPPPAPLVDASAASPTSRTIRGDWNDVPAALEVALSRAQMAIIRRTQDGPDLITYELISIGNDPVILTVARAAGAGDDLIDIQLQARAGHFGDPQLELNLLVPLAQRLSQLAGRDFAPL